MPVESNIFDYIKRLEIEYKKPVQINDVWNWGMKEHILTSDLYMNSQLLHEKDEFTPVKNITRPILNIQHRTEDIEVKDVQIYVNDSEKYHLSFLVKKYHDNVFVPKYNIDKFFDDLNVSRIDYGGGLSKQLNKPCPEVVPLQSIAFCDQTDILSGPIGLKHFYSASELLEMKAKGWGTSKNGATASIEDVIKLAREEKRDDNTKQTVKTPGKYIEVYEVHGNFPKRFTDPNLDTEDYEPRLFIVCFYTKRDSLERHGIVLYTAPEPELPFKLVKRDAIYGRGLGFGGAEELFEAQVWTNYNMIRKQDVIDATSKVILKSTDPTVTQKNKVRDLENLSVLDIAPGTDISQVDTVPRNVALFDHAINEWEMHAQDMGAAQDPVKGKAATSGTPFASVQSQIQQSMGLHDYRRGQYASHLEEIYRDWIIPHIVKEITKGAKFLSELTLEELHMVSEAVVTNQTNEFIKNQILSGVVLEQQDIDQYKQQAIATFKKKGNKHFIEILKGEFKDTELGVRVSIAGKSKDTGAMMDKISSVLRFMFANPYLLQSAPIAKLFNQMLDLAGIDPIDLSNFHVPMLPTRRMTEHIDFKDLPPDAQQAMLQVAGFTSQEAPGGAKPLI